MFFNKDIIDVDQLREQLTIDEGKVNEIYHDHLGYATFGIGHLVLDSDPENGQDVGTPVSEERVVECFEKDPRRRPRPRARSRAACSCGRSRGQLRCRLQIFWRDLAARSRPYFAGVNRPGLLGAVHPIAHCCAGNADEISKLLLRQAAGFHVFG